MTKQKPFKKIKSWFKYEKEYKQIFTLAGYAGTGKTLTIKELIYNLDIKIDRVAFMAYTGKASLVLREKGIRANTIHSVIYKAIVEENLKEEFLKKKRRNK